MRHDDMPPGAVVSVVVACTGSIRSPIVRAEPLLVKVKRCPAFADNCSGTLGAGILGRRRMRTLIFNFKTKTVGVVGTPATRRAYADVLAAQQKLIANSPSTAAQPQVPR